MTNTIVANTRCLGERSGIYDKVNRYRKGFEWIRLRENALKKGSPSDHAIVRKAFLTIFF